MATLHTTTRLNNHITHKSGKRKTVCVTACLTALGVPVNGFHVTGSTDKANWLKVLNRHGFSTRSRKSKLGKATTIGSARNAIKRMGEDALYLVIVWGAGYCHAMVLDNAGKTIVDTAPRKRDQRKIFSIHAVAKMI